MESQRKLSDYYPFSKPEIALLNDIEVSKQLQINNGTYEDFKNFYSEEIIIITLLNMRKKAPELELRAKKASLKAKDEASSLSDRYIKSALRHGSIPITDETIDLKRNVMLIKRITKKVKSKNNGKTEGNSATN